VIPEVTDRSYRALLAIPYLGRVVLSMQLARVAQQMVGVAMVLFTLAEYHSPALAGFVTFMSIFPGIVVSPIAGALLDRHGRLRLIRLDYVIALVTMVLIGGLAMAHLLSPGLLLVIATVSSLTGPFSQTGLRSLFPLMVPEPLWERVNALDSNGYLVASILGPPIAAGLVTLFGGQVAIMAIGLPFGLAALALFGVREPRTDAATSGSLRTDVLDGIRYAWGNRTIRGLAASISTLNLAGGIVTIVIPLLILERLHGSELLVGLAFAVSGLAGMVSVFGSARMNTRGREWHMLALPIALMAPSYALLLLANSSAGVSAPVLGFAVIGLSMLVVGLLNGPMDIGLFTIRQRRTDPAWMGRAFAISMALNFAGFPIGAAIAGALAATSLDLAILLAVVACIAAAIFTIVLVPRRSEEEVTVRRVLPPEAVRGQRLTER
jgi:MFS family permease